MLLLRLWFAKALVALLCLCEAHPSSCVRCRVGTLQCWSSCGHPSERTRDLGVHVDHPYGLDQRSGRLPVSSPQDYVSAQALWWRTGRQARDAQGPLSSALSRLQAA